MSSDLLRLVEQLESDPPLFAPDCLRTRIEVLDQLDLYLGTSRSEHAGLVPLYSRATAIRARLEAANSAVYQSMRSEIQQDSCASRLARWIHDNASHPPAPGLSYDGLDDVISGVLQLQTPEVSRATPHPDMVFYQPTPARHILDLISLCRFSSADVLVDIGSGLGHVPLLVSILTGIETIGIELEASYFETAQDCARRLRLDRVTFIHGDAREADLSAGTAFYLYTPFTGNMLSRVVGRLWREASRRPIRIATLGPCTETFAKESWLKSCSLPNAGRITLFQSAPGHRWNCRPQIPAYHA